MPQVDCKICKQEFYAKPNWLKKGWGKYCSLKCRHKGQKTGEVRLCFICNKAVYKPRKALEHSKSKKYFCNKSCQTIWRNSMLHVGTNHPNWKDGEYSYRTVMKRNKVPKICTNCKNKDGRILVVHHIDHNRKNNKLENLMWLCHNCHFLVHHDTKEREKLMETLV